MSPFSPDEFLDQYGQTEAPNSQKSAHPESKEDTLWTDDGNWNEADIPRRKWIAKGYLLRCALTVLSGPGGVSKSSLMVAYAVALSLGIPFHGFVPEAAFRVMTYNVEDDLHEQQRRFSAALRSTGRKPSDIAGKIMRLGPHKVGTLLANDPESGLSFTPAMEALEAQIIAFKPDVLILDPFVELHCFEENDNTALRNIMATFRALAVKHDIAIVILHHTRKGAFTAGDPDSVRGASSIIGAARIVLTVAPMSEDEAKALGFSPDDRRHYFRLDGAKSNYAPLTTAEWFQRIPCLLDNGDTVAAPEPWMPPVDVVSQEARAAIEKGIEAGSPAGPWSPKLSTDARSVKHLLARNGVATIPGQKKVLADLYTAGFAVATFRRPDIRVKAQGLRAPNGRPANVVWLDEAGEHSAEHDNGAAQ